MNYYKAGKYDIIVIGGGHAGVEASLAASRLGLSTLLLTISLDHVALMPCNPSVGGPAKGNVVREIDALGGQMGINADATQIQMRMLNTSKGPAVQALRAQIDKTEYRRLMAFTLENQENLDIKQCTAEEILIKNGRVAGVRCNNETEFECRALILTTGTYLKSRIILGKLLTAAGPNNQPNASELSTSLRDLGLELFRFKTGTPARVDKRSIDYSKTTEQPGSSEPLAFSYLTTEFNRPNVSCYSTYTNEETHKIIRDNLHLAPKYSGIIEGVGARYCPSIEDKVVRFPDREGHLLFLEPEGLLTNEIYVQGMSTGMPYEIQEKFMRTIPGLEQVKIMRPAYAIEYDGIVPTQLNPTLEYKAIEGLYGAGQINGTSGYEEAACQGLMAGINAALKLKEEEPFILTRSDGYIGVLVDDLVNKGTNEPYRLFTSRSEYRLLHRSDNADLRLTELGHKIGLVSDERYRVFLKRKGEINEARRWLETVSFKGSDKEIADYLEAKESAPVQGRISGTDLLKRPNIDVMDLAAFDGKSETWSKDVLKENETEIKYEGYLKKQREQIKRFAKTNGKRLPADICYKDIEGLRLEAAEKLDALKPYTIGQASGISGVSPADISVILVALKERGGKQQ